MKLVLEIKFAGGLGNQLFQYSMGRSLAIRNNVRHLVFNTDNYRNESLKRAFELTHFKVKGSELPNHRLKNVFVQNARLNKLASAAHLHKRVDENGFVFQRVDEQLGVLSSLYGFWQSERYFSEIRETLLTELVPVRVPQYPAWLSNDVPVVAIHVRRTDYLNEPRYGFVGDDYYRKAIEFILGRAPNARFVVFSDDMSWCRATFDNDFIFFDDPDWAPGYLQLHLMSRCTHQIIANSSFSWWGAWLNTNPQKMVMRPATPFREPSLLYEGHYPASWVAVDNTI